MAQPTILLFDVDGTLIGGGGAGRHSLELAFSELYPQGVDLSFSFAGKTDRAIVRQALEPLVASDALDEAIDASLERYLEHLETQIHQRDYVVFDGVAALLEQLKPLAHVALGLGTGNIERGARIKLSRGELNPYFSFGGFGSDDELRPKLIAQGLARGAAALEADQADCRCIIIGDTPLDVSAAHACGARAIGVATGPFDCDQLDQAGADWSTESLAAGDVYRWLTEG